LRALAAGLDSGRAFAHDSRPHSNPDETMLELLNPAVIGGGVAVAILFGILLSLMLGRWMGRRAIARHDAAGAPSISSLEAAVFGLLGLLIAFTFSGALSRFDLRRAQAVDEANAVGTAYLRIDLLPASAQSALRESFRNYIDARIATYRSLPDIEMAMRELARSRQLQGEIWSQAVAAVRTPESRPETELLLMPAINQMFDLAAVRVAATQMHPPLIIYVMLIGLALAAALAAGYQTAGEKGYDWIHKIEFAAIVAFTVYVILDIEYPRLGFVRLDAIDQVLVNVRAGMK
jgi:hypothetical protein